MPDAWSRPSTPLSDRGVRVEKLEITAVDSTAGTMSLAYGPDTLVAPYPASLAAFVEVGKLAHCLVDPRLWVFAIA